MKPTDITIPQRLGHLSRDPRGYPVIATVDRDSNGVDFGSIDEHRKLVLGTFDWCAVCGLPFRDEARWQFLLQLPEGAGADAVSSGEAPVHEICGVYAAQVCPFLSSPGARLGDDGRRGQRRPSSVLAAGYASTDAVDIRPSGLQDDMYVVHFSHNSAIDQVTYSDRNDLSKIDTGSFWRRRYPLKCLLVRKTLVNRFNAISTPSGRGRSWRDRHWCRRHGGRGLRSQRLPAGWDETLQRADVCHHRGARFLTDDGLREDR